MAIKMLFVKSGREDNRVALWERDPRHPDGEVFITGDQPVKVARTSAVAARLNSGSLVEVSVPKPDSGSKRAKSAAKTSEEDEGDDDSSLTPESPVREISGVGEATELSLGKAGIFTVGDLADAPETLEVEGVSAKALVDLRQKAQEALG